MESFRSILLIALAFVLFLLYQAWVEDYAPKPLPRQATDETGIETDDLPAGAPVTTDADMPSLAPVT
ncbi:MAG: membrane protein insertase YidC, partial [Gammaproteobacteria bacterium]|nr:membrane protein insertase YidC [Gammaproteobacteria bacterium]